MRKVRNKITQTPVSPNTVPDNIPDILRVYDIDGNKIQPFDIVELVRFRNTVQLCGYYNIGMKKVGERFKVKAAGSARVMDYKGYIYYAGDCKIIKRD